MPLQQITVPPDDQLGQPVDFPPLSVLYKHSPACSISAGAMLEVQAFAREHPDVPVFVVDVLGQQSLSRRLE
ncbi:MAG TPA: monothiol bacilliredoxin BrxC family protein, partial [Gemmatimonas sp.]|nr:monothiol bacilliredoxin BrxC family protein [Gemmatimonas sp.]